MKEYMILCLTFFCFTTEAQVTTISPGEIAPDIKLLSVSGKMVSFDDYPAAKGFIVIFTCNTCPYSKAYEQRVMALNNKYVSLGFPVIAINPNDPESSPGDSFEKMKERAFSKKYTFPYLYDEGQFITTAYGAKNTPHVFVINKTTQGNTIVYTGAIDNDTPDTNPAKIKYVEDAISALIENKTPAVIATKAIGCRIVWKKTNG
ncbi:MAG TPA: thioredoxin family protein [Panacibacter sp.]|nr:thioredoxin family protein [Panacibacter sp.]